MLTPNHLYSFK